MRLCVYTEPEFVQSLWHAAALRGIGEEARRKRYELTFVSANELGLNDDSEDSVSDELLESVIFGREANLDSNVELIAPIIVIGSSPTRLARLTERLKACELGALLLNIVSENGEFSSISMDYENATRLAVRHLHDCGRARLALFAVNSDSGSDRAKLAAFNESTAPSGEVFYNRDGLAECVERFIANADKIDGVICANDIAGIALLTALKSAGIDVPGQLSLMSFGDSASAGSLCSALGVTLITVDHAKLGRHAVTLAAYLARAGSSLNATVKLSSELEIGRTTGAAADSERSKPRSLIKAEREHRAEKRSLEPTARDFYDDRLVREVMQIEALAEAIDETDRRLLILLASGESVQSAAEQLYISQGTASYRLRRMISQLGMSSRSEMLELVRRYFEVN